MIAQLVEGTLKLTADKLTPKLSKVRQVEKPRSMRPTLLQQYPKA